MKREFQDTLKLIVQKLGANYSLREDLIIFGQPNNILLGVFFERSGFQKDEGFYIWVFVQPLFVKAESLIFNFGNRVRSPGNSEFWSNDLLTEQILFNSIVDASKYFNINDSVEKFYTTNVLSPSLHIVELKYLAYAACYLNPELGEKRLRDLQTEILGQTIVPVWMKYLHDDISRFLDLSLDERINELNMTTNSMLYRFKINLSKK